MKSLPDSKDRIAGIITKFGIMYIYDPGHVSRSEDVFNFYLVSRQRLPLHMRQQPACPYQSTVKSLLDSHDRITYIVN